MKILKFPVDGPKPTQIQTTLSGFGFEKKKEEKKEEEGKKIRAHEWERKMTGYRGGIIRKGIGRSYMHALNSQAI